MALARKAFKKIKLKMLSLPLLLFTLEVLSDFSTIPWTVAR